MVIIKVECTGYIIPRKPDKNITSFIGVFIIIDKLETLKITRRRFQRQQTNKPSTTQIYAETSLEEIRLEYKQHLIK